MLALFEAVAVGRAISRRALDVMLGWLILLVAFALLPVPWLVWPLMLLPLVAAVLLLRQFPLAAVGGATIGTANANITIGGQQFGAEQVRAAGTALALLLAVQLGMGVYAYFVPVHQARGLVPPLVALVAMWAVLGPIAGIDLRKSVRQWMVVVGVLIILITIAFFVGGTNDLGDRVGGLGDRVQRVNLPNRTAAPTQSPKSAEIAEHPPVVAPVYDWSQWVSIPRNNWIRIDPEDIVDMQFAGGRTVRIYAVKYNRPVYDGEDVREGAFRLRSASGAPEEVIIAFQPK